MNVYLTVITTILVVTQVIRVTQNAISLHRQNKEIKRNLEWINRAAVGEKEFQTQKNVFALLEEYLEIKQADGWK